MINNLLPKIQNLKENNHLVVRAVINKNIIKVQFDNDTLFMSPEDLKEFKTLIKICEKYGTEFYIVPKHNSKP